MQSSVFTTAALSLWCSANTTNRPIHLAFVGISATSKSLQKDIRRLEPRYVSEGDKLTMKTLARLWIFLALAGPCTAAEALVDGDVFVRVRNAVPPVVVQAG